MLEGWTATWRLGNRLNSLRLRPTFIFFPFLSIYIGKRSHRSGLDLETVSRGYHDYDAVEIQIGKPPST